MGEPQPTALCPVCGTRSLVDPTTGKVRAHLRKGGVRCEGKKEPAGGVARLVPPFLRRRPKADDDGTPAGATARIAADAESAEPASDQVRIRVTCPVCGRFCGVDLDDIRIRQHRNRANQKCRGSGMVPELEDLKLDGITPAEVRKRRKETLAKEKRAARAAHSASAGGRPGSGLRGTLTGVLTRKG